MDEQQVIDDIAIEVGAVNSGDELEPVPSGAYTAVLVGFKQEDKPQWKIDQQAAQHPDKDVDKLQWAFTFEITEGDWAGRKLTTWENRSLTWHPRANAAKHAAALFGLDNPEDMRGKGYSTKMLIGREAQIWVNEKNGKSYIDKVVKLPRKKAAAASTSAPEGDLTTRLKAALATLNYPSGLQKAHYQEVVPDNTPFKELDSIGKQRVVEFFEAKVAQLEPDDLDF